MLIIAHGKLVAFDTPQNLEKTLATANKLTLTADCGEAALQQILDSVPNVATRETKPDGTAVLTVNGDLTAAARALFFAFAKANVALLQLTPQKADLENIFIELTEDDPQRETPNQNAEKQEEVAPDESGV